MAKRANAGRMRTQAVVRKYAAKPNNNGIIAKTERELLFEMPVWCEWVNAHGKEFYEASSLNLQEAATLTMRYSPKVTVDCLIVRQEDGAEFKIISIDNISMLNEWLELKVARVVSK